jgi:hypothetical protein
MSLRPVLVLVVLGALHGTALAGTTFTSTWRAPEATGVSFAGQKVVALVISADENLRISGEEGLVREITGLGIQGVAAYRVIPKEELQDPEKARGWFERSQAAGVVAMRPVSADKERTYVPGTWASPSYSSLWGYYGYGWGAVYSPGYVKEDTRVVIETLIYRVADGKLLWAGLSESTNPKSTAKLLKDLVEEAVKEMRKQGLAGGAGR